MYIHSTYKFINKNENASYYKKLLKEVSSINLRRSNKFDIISVYGACKCLENINNYSKDLNIYIASKHGVISGVLKILESFEASDNIIMPFDFLNMNGNNAGFNISQALNTNGESMLINTNDFPFEQSIKYAFSKSKNNHLFEAIVGGVDESLSNIPNYQEYLINKSDTSYDGSSWLYLNNNRQNAIAKIEEIIEFISQKELNNYLKNNLNFEVIYSTSIAELTYATQNSSNLIDTLNSKQKFIYITKYNDSHYFIIKIINC